MLQFDSFMKRKFVKLQKLKNKKTSKNILYIFLYKSYLIFAAPSIFFLRELRFDEKMLANFDELMQWQDLLGFFFVKSKI